MSASQIPDQGRNKNMTWQPKEKKSFSRDITVVFQVYFFAIDHVYENNSFNASTMVTI